MPIYKGSQKIKSLYVGGGGGKEGLPRLYPRIW